jgi:hypothetical protein
MRVVCAWCQQEGRSRLLRVGEPLEDTSETHGICNRHQQEIFEMFPSRSFPSTRWLFIVSSDPRAYSHLVAVMRDVPGVTVIMERRRNERRRAKERRGEERPAQERRHAERRIRHPERHSLGYMLVRFSRRDVEASPVTLPKPPADRGDGGQTESTLRGMTLLQATA